MKVACIGIHKRFCEDHFFDQLFQHISYEESKFSDCLILKTCNRIEIYIENFDLETRHPEVLALLIPPFSQNASQRFYTYMGSDVLKHLSMVASGLDSLIVGETDIQSQVRKAYALYGKNFGSDGHFLFQKALQISKKVRTLFEIKPKKPLVSQVIDDLEMICQKDSKLVFLGHSDLNLQLIEKLASLGFYNLYLASSFIKKEPFTSQNIKQITYQNLDEFVFDGAIIATSNRKLHQHSFIKNGGFLFDLSRPKVFLGKSLDLLYKELSEYETSSIENALLIQQNKIKACDFITKDVQKMYESRQRRKELKLTSSF